MRIRHVLQIFRRSYDWPKRAILNDVIRLLRVALIFSCLFFIVLLLYPHHRVVALASRTQVVRFNIVDPEGCTSSRVSILEMSDGSHPPQRFQRAKVTLENGVHVTARRQGRSALILELNVERNRQAVGWLNYDGGKREFEIPRGTTLFVKPSEAGNESFIIPIRGQMWIGDEVTAGVDDILLEGAAAIIEESLWGGRFVAKTEPLTIGDAVTIVGASGDIAIGEGFVFVGELGGRLRGNEGHYTSGGKLRNRESSRQPGLQDKVVRVEQNICGPGGRLLYRHSFFFLYLISIV